MIDIRIAKLLKEYSTCRRDKKTNEIKILESKYDAVFSDTKYLFEQIFTLGKENYQNNLDSAFIEIEQRESVLIAILEELIDLSK